MNPQPSRFYRGLIIGIALGIVCWSVILMIAGMVLP